jgi:hypothetical protein
MQSHLGHVQFNIKAENMGFYRDLLSFVGWPTIYDVPEMLGMGPDKGSLWFFPQANDAANDYDGAGMNHVGIHVDAQGDVDTAVAWLKERNIPALFETPRHRPEFSQGDDTYYQVMFESPDRILFEVVYIGPKS